MSEDKKEIETNNVDDARREFLKHMGIAAGAVALAGSPEAEAATFQEWFQSHYELMSEEEKQEAIARLETRYTEEYEKKVTVSGAPALEGVLFGYALNIQKCIGCRTCVHACVQENNQSRYDPEIQWIKVLKMEKGSFSADKLDKGYPETERMGDYGLQVGGNAYSPAGVSIEDAQRYYEPEQVPEKDSFYMPVQCHQCEKPPCVKTCPVRATFREPNGVVVIDYNWCIGCRMCQLACPYGARRFNWGEPNLPKEDMNPKTHYYGNRPRMRGVMEKCTFCLQRTREGRNPACMEACPVGARKFGNLLDPQSEIRQVLATKKVFRFKEEFHTYPKFFYFMD
ncbi:4Fe-4S dicluster domain-containing protein [Ferrigenium sp. UT5]|uniref:4Fe-4S dicluster domain-containing protein n=1 Tax=Ferrigenium sp. UT5 TaxID=3242105 RepID=UPI00354CAE11